MTSGRAWAGESDREYAKRLATWEDKLATDPARRARERAGTYADRCAQRRAKLQANRPVRHQGAAERWGLLGWVRATEVTHGDNGWHPHFHVVLVFEGEQTEDCVRRFAETIWPAWERALERRGYSALRDSGGLDVRCSTSEAAAGIAEYFVKSLALEATHGHAKEGRRGGRTPLQLLHDVTTTGDVDDLDRWHEWESASKGRRQLTWSRGLRTLAGLAEQEMTDEDIAAEELDGEDLIFLEPETWRAVRDDAGDLLVIAEREGLLGVEHWLRARGLGWIAAPVMSQSARQQQACPPSL